MSQQSPLTQSAHFVRQVLRAYTPGAAGARMGPHSELVKGVVHRLARLIISCSWLLGRNWHVSHEQGVDPEFPD